MYNSQEIAKIIKTTAKSKGISIKQLLSSCDLSINALSSMQSGGFFPRLESIVKIADYLDCSVDYLLGRDKRNDNLGSDEPDEDCSVDISLSEQEKIFLDKYQDLPDNLKLELVKTVNDFIDNFLKR